MRQLPKAPSLRRTVEKIQPKVEIVIACEGENTEPRYIQDCVAHYGAGLVRLRLIPRFGVPLTVVRTAIAEREMLLARVRSRWGGVKPELCFRVWAIFDKDDHDVAEALALAKENGVDVAFSNPCFELWALLHLENYGAQDGRHDLQRRLRDFMPTYDHDHGAVVDFVQIASQFPVAFQRARALNQARVAEDCEGGCPSTTVGDLVLKIVENGKFNFRAKVAKELG